MLDDFSCDIELTPGYVVIHSYYSPRERELIEGLNKRTREFDEMAVKANNALVHDSPVS